MVAVVMVVALVVWVADVVVPNSLRVLGGSSLMMLGLGSGPGKFLLTHIQ